jgi:hypothetical protein
MENETYEIRFRELSTGTLVWQSWRRPGLLDDWQPPHKAPAELVYYCRAEPGPNATGGWLLPGVTLAEVRENAGEDLRPLEPSDYLLTVPVAVVEQLKAAPLQGEPGPSREGWISNLADLCDYWGAEEPERLNRRVYKGTECGASISVQLMDGEWLHNGADGWESLTPETPIRAFTLQTIVEGSDATVDSEPFYLPVTPALVETWIAEMEAEASRLWERDNLDHFLIYDLGESNPYGDSEIFVAGVVTGWGEARFLLPDDLPMDKIQGHFFDDHQLIAEAIEEHELMIQPWSGNSFRLVEEAGIEIEERRYMVRRDHAVE